MIFVIINKIIKVIQTIYKYIHKYLSVNQITITHRFSNLVGIS